jgi:hypothetical protein
VALHHALRSWARRGDGIALNSLAPGADIFNAPRPQAWRVHNGKVKSDVVVVVV